MASNTIEKYPLNRRKHYVNRNFQIFDDINKSSSSSKKASSKVELKPNHHHHHPKPEFILSIHHKEGLDVDNGLRQLMTLLKESKGKEIYQYDSRTSLHIKGLDNIYYKTRKPLQTHNVCKRFKPGMPVWIYFKTTCEISEETKIANENDNIDYTPKERLHYGYRGRLQREQLKIKQQKQNQKQILSSANDPSTNLTSIHRNTPLSTICHLVTLGSFLDCGTFIAHTSTLPDIDKFELEFRSIPQSIYLRSIKNPDYLNTNDDLLYNKILYSVSISHDHIESYLILNHQDDFIDLFIPLLYVLKPIQEIELDDLGTRKRTRATRFHRFDTKHIAQSSVMHVRIPLLNTSSKMINDLASKLLENNIKVLYGNIKIVYIPNDYISPYENLQFGNYLCNYAWHMLMSLGYRLKDKLTDEFVSKLVDISNDSSLFYHALRDLWKTCKDNPFMDIYISLCNNTIKYADVGARWLFDCTTPNYCYVPRVIVTPTQILPQPMRPMKENRVLRGGRFGSSFAFCRVLLRDEDLVTMSAETVEQCRERILDLIKQDLTIAQTDYEYLHCSNSQLRDRSFWFYKPNNGNTAETIRNWMGDFRYEYSVSSYVTRMALCFTGSIKTFTIQKATEIEEIPDFKSFDGRYVFTDGIGKISEPMMRRVFEALDLNQTTGYLPCALQIRMAGMKGVLVKAPELGSREIIQVRRSQIKFECDHYDLEVIDYSKPCNLTLNRQVITLLSSLGVQDIAFLHIQNESRLRATMALLKCREAISLLDKVRFFEFEKISNSGIDISQEPFFRSLLIAAYRDRLRCLKQRSNISIPKTYGRAMFGIIDESRTLQYGEVFIQYTSNSQIESEIVLGYVAVTKNPCLYPGDIRILKAIDVPHLHHLHDCIVFPCNGNRPHTNEISGSDLDGDVYWVCWLPDLVPNLENQIDPLDYDTLEKKLLDHAITMDDVAEFLIDYMANDFLGELCNAHLAWADLELATSPRCIELAHDIAAVVDYPKTGINPVNDEKRRELKAPRYPDFMEKEIRTYSSRKVLGKIYRQARCAYDLHVQLEYVDQQHFIEIDETLLTDGFESYLDDAKRQYNLYCNKLQQILDLYDYSTEAELITGCQPLFLDEKRSYDAADVAGQDFKRLRTDTRREFLNEFIRYNEKQQHRKRDREITLISPDPKIARLQLQKASAWYYIAYTEEHDDHDHLIKSKSFAWIMWDFLCEIRSRKERIHHLSSRTISEALKSYYITMANVKSRHISNYENARTNLYKYLLEDQCEHLFEPAYSFLNIPELTGSRVRVIIDSHNNLDKSKTIINLNRQQYDIVPLNINKIKLFNKANRFYWKLLMQQPAIATVLEIAIDWAAKHQCFTRTDREGNKILVLKPEIFFERALKALFKDVPACYLPSFDDDADDDDENNKIINGSNGDDTVTSTSDDDEHSIKVTNKKLNADLFLTYEQWTNYMIDKWDFQAIAYNFQKLIRVCNDEKDICFLNVCHLLLLALQKIGITRTLDNAPIDLKDSLVYRLDQPINRTGPSAALNESISKVESIAPE
ncbi:unnamed protein product [Adineta steineri]|uniref:RNA-directed RNA polymerase n=1 Tax=Adineta steineri TaxID=433720 RepID=A0A814Z750_9BILA|nr:unnamed protein product [Adineta steineri]CAF3670497.1 unnamed protein product [Adineta steineri]